MVSDPSSTLPLVSCILPTFARPPSHQHLIEEAIECFLRQDYQNKELIVLNDCPEQVLICDYPGVRVINADKRYPSLGEKRNDGVRMSRGDIIAMWDDDDISLPWRLSYCIERLGSGEYFNTQYSWYMDSRSLHPQVKVLPASSLSVFRRAAFEAVGGYPLTSFGGDQVLEDALRARVRPDGYPVPRAKDARRSEVYYIYRWGVSPVHISGRNRPGMYDEIAARPITPGEFVLQPHWRMDYVEAVARLSEDIAPEAGSPSGNDGHSPIPVVTNGFYSISTTRDQRESPIREPALVANLDSNTIEPAIGLPTRAEIGDKGRQDSAKPRRAIVSYVEDRPHLVQQLLALRRSWIDAEAPDTDLVVFGPEDLLRSLPTDIVRIPQDPAADDPAWHGYRKINAVACMNRSNSEELESYTHLLRTDLDTFIASGWNDFRPSTFTVGKGAYVNNKEVSERIRNLAAMFRLDHVGVENVGTTWYGTTEQIRRVAALAEMLTRHLINHDFREKEGAWPGWYRGVAFRYAVEIAVNHLISDVEKSDLLDAQSTSANPLSTFAHIHCWHTRHDFSKHRFMSGGYSANDLGAFDRTTVAGYCLATSLASLADLPQSEVT